ncbi:MAG: TolC family protein [Bacteroidaceae bacterium]|nr:TolC family protein [Bacteroidaceae bacterium]
MNMRFLALMLAVPAVTAVKAQTERMMTVEDLFQLVESNSKTLQETKISVEFAQKGIEAARSQRLPDVNAALSASYNGNVVVMDRDFTNANGFSSPHFGNSFALEAQQVVYAGGAINAGIRMAELQRDMAQSGHQMNLQTQRFLALGQYLDLYKIQNRMQVMEQNILLTQRLIDNIQAKHQQGMALKNDVTRYELQMETLQLGLRRLQDQRTVINHQLCNTLGLAEVSIVPDSAVVSSVLTHQDVNSWKETALTSSPRMQQSLLSSQMAEQQLRLAKSELLPKVALVAADNFSGPFTYDIPPLDKNINYWYVGVGVQYPISSLFKKNKKVEQARIGILKSQEGQRVAAESIDNQIHEAWTLFQQSFADLDTQRKSVQLARQNYQVVDERYLGQMALITDMLDASNILLNAELQEVDARINIIYAYYKMKYIAGTL